MDAIVRCGRCLAGGRGCLLKGPHLIPSLKFRLPYLINVHQSINPFLLKSRGMKYCPLGKPRLINACVSLNCSFIMTSTYDVLPSPSNLKRWRICTESSCFLCSKEICTTTHVLGACKVSLTQGRFTFRHDSALSELASILLSFIKALPLIPPKRLTKLAFVKAGKSVSKSKVKPTGILHLASDWVIVSDLKNSYIFPGHIALTSLRPDIVIFSNSLKRVMLIELTC